MERSLGEGRRSVALQCDQRHERHARGRTMLRLHAAGLRRIDPVHGGTSRGSVMVSRRALFLGLGAVAATGGAGIAWRLWQANASHEPPAPPSVDAQGNLLWRNWSGIQSAYPLE